MSKPEKPTRVDEKGRRWYETKTDTRMRYEKSHPWHLPQPDTEAFKRGYEAVDWTAK